MGWRENRKLANLMNVWDDIIPAESRVVNNENVVEQVIEFFKTESKLIYPAKSIFVAIVYARCLERYFDIPFKEALNIPDLLEDDMFFQPYKAIPDIYDEVVDKVGNIWLYSSIEKTVGYFKKEFLIEEFE